MAYYYDPNQDPESQYQKKLSDQEVDQGLSNMARGTTPGNGTDYAKDFPMYSGVMGENEFRPSWHPIDEMASERDRMLALQSRGKQMGLAGRLEDTMAGNGPTVAGLQMSQGIAEALRNAGTQAANARGTSRALAQRSAIYGGQNAAAQANRDAGLLRAQEQLAARGQYGTLAEQMRMGDLQTRQQAINIEHGNQQAWGQHEGYMTQIQEGNATRKQKGAGSIASAVGAAMASDIRAKQDVAPADGSFASQLRKSLDVQPDQWTAAQWSAGNLAPGSQDWMQTQPQQPQQQVATQQDNSDAGGIGGILSSVGGGLMSDKRSKQDLAPLQPYSFSYKPGIAAAMAEQAAATSPPPLRDAVRATVYADARAPREGIMAQDLERSPRGKKVVMDTPAGKALDMKRSIAFLLANQAGLDKRLSRVEVGP
jgi:hypothetical protein